MWCIASRRLGSDLSRDGAAAIYGDGGPVHVCTSPATQKQASTGDILRGSNATQGYSSLDSLAKGLEGGSHHLALKRPACQGVRAANILLASVGHASSTRVSIRNVSLAQVVCENPAEVVQTGLAGTVGEGLEGGNTEAVNAANVDDASRVIRGRCLLQERSHKLSEIEDPVEVEGENTSESGGGILVVGSTPV